MIKKNFGLILILIILFGISTTVYGTGKFSITLDGGYAGAFSLNPSTYGITNQSYSTSGGPTFVTINTDGSITPTASAGIIFGGSLDYSFTDIVGISLGFHTFKQDVDLVNDYQMAFTWAGWLGGATWDLDDISFTGKPPWSSIGDISVMPLTLDLTFKKDFSPTFSAGGSIGAALFLTKVNMNAYMGHHAKSGIYYNIWNYSYKVDFYKVDVAIVDDSQTLFGGHIQGFLEIKLSPRFAFLIAANYYLAGKKEIPYALVDKSRWDGLFGNLYRLSDPNIEEHNFELNVSFFSVNAGIRVYLN